MGVAVYWEEIKKSTQYSAELQMNFTQEYNSKIKLQYPVYTECTQLETARNLLPINSPKRDPNRDLTSYLDNSHNQQMQHLHMRKVAFRLDFANNHISLGFLS